MKNKALGFTLTEILIVITIVGIMAAIAYPSYSEHIKRSQRADAQAALTSLANAMEMWKLQNSGSYLGAGSGGANTGSPGIFSAVVPVSGGKVTYNLTIAAATSGTYTLQATPVGMQASDGWLKLDNLGVKTCQNTSACLHGTSW